ncbi:MAG: DegT/DnrJ/EryC1/StrS family aminotransferase [Gammaproteobacteria bacterium]
MDTENITLPAILGGVPAVTLDQATANRWPVLTQEDEDAVLQVMRDGNISTHPVIRELEQDYRALTGRKYALAHCNGTAALLAAFFALDLQPGDEVIVPSATFWASALPMLWVGAVPVFCESEPERLGPDPEDIERRITDRTRAIVVVHLWGMPCRMSEIGEIARRHGLRVIEDASHAHGAKWNQQPCGALGDLSVFSLQGDKLAPGGEGGVLLTDDYALYERATCLGDITRIIELETPARRFAATSFGIKTRIAPMSAALARVQLKHLPERNRQRNGNLQFLSRKLASLGFDTFLPPAHIERTYFEFLVRAKPEHISLPINKLIEALQSEGCEIGVPRYPLLHQQPFFTEGHYRRILRCDRDDLPDYARVSLPVTERVNDTMIKLPAFPNAEHALLEQYAHAFEKVVTHADAILAKS